MDKAGGVEEGPSSTAEAEVRPNADSLNTPDWLTRLNESVSKLMERLDAFAKPGEAGASEPTSPLPVGSDAPIPAEQNEPNPPRDAPDSASDPGSESVPEVPTVDTLEVSTPDDQSEGAEGVTEGPGDVLGPLIRKHGFRLRHWHNW